MKARGRSGQAALEYLVTYGWGFIAIFVVVGAMAYYGFLSPTRYLPERCEFGTQLLCVDFKLVPAGASPNGVVLLQFRNNFGDSVNITRIWTSSDIEPALEFGAGSSWPALGLLLGKGVLSEQITAEIDPSDTIIVVDDERQSVFLTIEFRRDMAGAPLHNVTGEIFSTAR